MDRWVFSPHVPLSPWDEWSLPRFLPRRQAGVVIWERPRDVVLTPEQRNMGEPTFILPFEFFILSDEILDEFFTLLSVASVQVIFSLRKSGWLLPTFVTQPEMVRYFKERRHEERPLVPVIMPSSRVFILMGPQIGQVGSFYVHDLDNPRGFEKWQKFTISSKLLLVNMSLHEYICVSPYTHTYMKLSSIIWL